MSIWLIYALGGGWGHLTRSLSLGRMATRYHHVKILTNTPYATYLGGEGCDVQIIAPNVGFAATCEQVRDVLLNTRYDCLIVDTFPRGLGGELADILPQLKHIPRILIHRDISPVYIHRFALRSFVKENFDAVIVPGEGEDSPLADLPIVHYTSPWLIRNAEELPNRMKARSLLGLNALGLDCDRPSGSNLRLRQRPFKKKGGRSCFAFIQQTPPAGVRKKIILVCAAGQASELSFFGKLSTHLNAAFPDAAVRVLAPVCPDGCPPQLWVSHSPGIECLLAADVVVGGAGYNTVYECAAVGVPLVAFAFKRLYDRQKVRALRCAYCVEEIEDAIATVAMLQNQVSNRPADYPNGAVEAVRLIEKQFT
ncbi:UDP-N-acetylglucosamine--LPS N-acetylglucosamine transferase [Coleofasciculus sp. FACHB-129]|uniref:UDP-N-acetylglucosamine--LPS N-acetylglucosamine transferase n=1 Tax=Cyanophyceae TaxID=3028117 RepID=UPI00168431F7|nr:UDP-N-acetylglucosamine--LPS N-acetylglucosamine transferase [Coleofasciculus sp. FACHB-129]MBD1895992.1 UDP-N-acetylglucosamine--LPS N-acetylglucosamine transferase [Coleofasciculus sp. FACHB-129]